MESYEIQIWSKHFPLKTHFHLNVFPMKTMKTKIFQIFKKILTITKKKTEMFLAKQLQFRQNF